MSEIDGAWHCSGLPSGTGRELELGVADEGPGGAKPLSVPEVMGDRDSCLGWRADPLEMVLGVVSTAFCLLGHLAQFAECPVTLQVL